MLCAKYNLQSERIFFEHPVDLYADDTIVKASADVKNLDHLDQSLNKSAREIQAWTSVNKLPTNEDKTKVLTITGKRLKSKLNSELSVRTDSDNTLCNVEKLKCSLVGFRN